MQIYARRAQKVSAPRLSVSVSAMVAPKSLLPARQRHIRQRPGRMTDRIGIGLAILILGFLAADLLVFHWDIHLFLARKFVVLIEWVAFWR